MKNDNLFVNLFTAALIFITSSCNSPDKPIYKLENINTVVKPTVISINDLAKSYKNYQGKYIETTGRFYQSFEEFAIYANPVTSDDSAQGFWLSTDGNLELDSASLQKMNGKLIKIKGAIDTTGKGHLNGYFATISKIYYWEEN